MSEEGKESPSGITFPADDRKPTAVSSLSTSTSGSRKVVIKSADMKEEMQNEAVNIAIAAFENCSVEKDVAEQIKKQFDKNHGPTWHCIVGKNFACTNLVVVSGSLKVTYKQSLKRSKTKKVKGSYVTHETNHFVYFYLESKAVLLFKSG